MAKTSPNFDPAAAAGLALALRGLARLHVEGDAVLRRVAIAWIGDLADPDFSEPTGQASLRERGYLLFGQDADKVDLGMNTAGEAHSLGLGLTVYDLGGYHYRVALSDPARALGQFVDVFSIRPARPVIEEVDDSPFATAAGQVEEFIPGDSLPGGDLAVPAALTALIAIGAGAPAVGLGGLDVPRGRRGIVIKDQLKALQKQAGLTAKRTPPAMAQAANLADRQTADAIAAYSVAGMIGPAYEGGTLTDIHTGRELTLRPAGEERGTALSGGAGQDSLAGSDGGDSLGAKIPSNLRLIDTVGGQGANLPHDVVLTKLLLSHTRRGRAARFKFEEKMLFDGPVNDVPHEMDFLRGIAVFRAGYMSGTLQPDRDEFLDLQEGGLGSERFTYFTPGDPLWATLIAKSGLEGQNNLRFAGDSTLIYRPQDRGALERFVEGIASYTALHGDWAGAIKSATTALYDSHGLLVDFADGTSTALAKHGGSRTGTVPGLTLLIFESNGSCRKKLASACGCLW